MLYLSTADRFQHQACFPFDSGAFHLAFYEAYLHKQMRLGDFSLEPNFESAAKIVKFFFGSDANYMNGTPGPRPTLDVSEYEIASYADIIASRGSNAMDSRSATVEVQTEDHLSVHDVVEAVVLPSSFVDSKLGMALKELSIVLLPYNSINKYAPNEFSSELHNVCTRYYIEKAYLEAERN